MVDNIAVGDGHMHILRWMKIYMGLCHKPKCFKIDGISDNTNIAALFAERCEDIIDLGTVRKISLIYQMQQITILQPKAAMMSQLFNSLWPSDAYMHL